MAASSLDVERRHAEAGGHAVGHRHRAQALVLEDDGATLVLQGFREGC